MNSLKTINYSGIFLSCYCNNGTRCTHMVRDHVLVYIYSGELVLEENGKISQLRKGECVFIRRDHRVVMTKKAWGDEQFRAIFLTYRRNSLRKLYANMDKKEIPERAGTHPLSVVQIAPRPDIESLFHSLTPYFDTAIQPSEEIVSLKEQEGLYLLLNTDVRFYPCLFDFTEPWKIDIFGFLDENYMYDLSLEEIAAFTGRSLATFKRDFSKICTLSPQKWLIQKRLKMAYDKLQVEGKTASEIYVEVGFKNLSHFYTAFKRQYGFSPRK